MMLAISQDKAIVGSSPVFEAMFLYQLLEFVGRQVSIGNDRLHTNRRLKRNQRKRWIRSAYRIWKVYRFHAKRLIVTLHFVFTCVVQVLDRVKFVLCRAITGAGLSK